MKIKKISATLEPDRNDHWTWENSDTGCYSVKSAYHWLQDQQQHIHAPSNWNWLWKLKVMKKVRIFLWLILHGSLPVNQHRFKCNLTASPGCSRCSAAEETILHCLRDCLHSQEIWLKAGAASWLGFRSADFAAWVSSLSQSHHGIKFV